IRDSPDIVHAIALKPIALSLLAGAHGAGRVFAVTGRGYLGVRGAAWTRFVLDRLAGRMRRAIADGDAMLLVENEADRGWIEAGTPLPDARVLLMPGAGVDAEKFKPAAEPAGSIKIGIASRLVWSKGVDIAVEALRRLRNEGRDFELHIAGGPDRANPEHVPDSEFARWAATSGIVLHGPVNDVAAFWAGVHVACFPSRGGEGLPRSLLEAAACGRAIVAVDTPGCADFVRAGDAGVLVPSEDPDALAAALARFADDAPLRQRLGATARALVLARYTEAHAADCAAEAWARLG
ncbi:MAG: glycosyltransferase, partial [Terricaulis sp.]